MYGTLRFFRSALQNSGDHELLFDFKQPLFSVFKRKNEFDDMKMIVNLGISRESACLDSNFVSFFVNTGGSGGGGGDGDGGVSGELIGDKYYNYDRNKQGAYTRIALG